MDPTQLDKNRPVTFSNPSLRMFIIEGVLFLILYYWFSESDVPNAYRMHEWPEAFAYEPTNFHTFEILAGIAYFIQIVACWILFNVQTTKKRLITTAFWSTIMTIAICAAVNMASVYVCNWHYGGACWSDSVVYNSALQVALCGLAYAVPVAFGIYLASRYAIDRNKPFLSVFLSIAIVMASACYAAMANIFFYFITWLLGI